MGILEHCFHALGIGDEVRRDVALVELHALGELELHRRGARLLNGDDAVLAHLVECVSDESTDLGILRGDGRDLRDFVLAGNRACHVVQLLGDSDNSLVDAALDADGRCAGRDLAQALVHHRLSENGGGGGAVACDVVGLGRNFLGQLGAEVLVRVLELDLLGDGHAIVRDRGRAPLLVNDHIAALGAEGHLDGISECIDTALQAVTCVFVEFENLCHCVSPKKNVAESADDHVNGPRGGALR